MIYLSDGCKKNHRPRMSVKALSMLHFAEINKYTFDYNLAPMLKIVFYFSLPSSLYDYDFDEVLP